MDAQAKLNVFSKLSSFVSNIVRSYNRRENGSHQRFRCVHIQNLRRKEEKKKETYIRRNPGNVNVGWSPHSIRARAFLYLTTYTRPDLSVHRKNLEMWRAAVRTIDIICTILAKKFKPKYRTTNDRNRKSKSISSYALLAFDYRYIGQVYLFRFL
jgi:hypothetical protein